MARPGMTEDDIAKANQAFEQATGTKVPPPRKSAGQPESWPDPQLLHGALRRVSKLRPEMIPEPYHPWLADIAHRMQCPLDFVASAAICMTSGVIGAGCAIRPKEKDNWTVVPNLWGGIIARPGMKRAP